MKSFVIFLLVLTSSTVQCSVYAPSSLHVGRRKTHRASIQLLDACVLLIRGGDQGEATTTAVERVLTLDEKVQAAMRKLGLQPPSDDPDDDDDVAKSTAIAENTLPLTTSVEDTSLPIANDDDATTTTCVDGVCEMPPTEPSSSDPQPQQEDPRVIANRITQSMKVDASMVWAALGATSMTVDNIRTYNEQAARDMIQVELDMISQIREDSDDVQQLVAEGYHDIFLVRRALAFAERSVEDARAILMADKMDEEEEAEAAAKEEAEYRASLAAQKRESEASFKTVKVAADFDPAKIEGTPSVAVNEPPTQPLQPASRDAVVFEATTAQVQELVLESPVPVILDIYADWCGPCKALSPILEELAIKGGGSFRLVKVNSDNERVIATALEITALPTIFGFRDGKILNMFQGMPKSEEMMRDFLMGLLIPGRPFIPPVSATEQKKYLELSTKLLKVAGSAGFSFSARERLHDKVATRLEELVKQTGDVFDAEQSATTVRSLLSNILRDPYEAKFRTINLANKVVANKVARYPACMAMLKSVGFVADHQDTMTIGKNKKIINVTPLSVTREAIDKWIDKTRYEVARAARKRRDEADRERIQAELTAGKADEKGSTEEDAAEAEVNPNECNIKLRLDGKKKVHYVALHADDPLSIVLEKLPGLSAGDGEVQITCVAKRLVVKSTDSEAMNKSLREHGLMPNAAIVVKLATCSQASIDVSASKLAKRAAGKKKVKKGSHTMQSVGIYAKDDNAKGELIDGGGGTWYEHDVSDDEIEQPPAEREEEQHDYEAGENGEPTILDGGDEAQDTSRTPSKGGDD